MSSMTSPAPSRMMEPLPNCFSICDSAAASALLLSLPAPLSAAWPLTVLSSMESSSVGATSSGVGNEMRYDSDAGRRMRTAERWRCDSSTDRSDPPADCVVVAWPSTRVLSRLAVPSRFAHEYTLTTPAGTPALTGWMKTSPTASKRVSAGVRGKHVGWRAECRRGTVTPTIAPDRRFARPVCEHAIAPLSYGFSRTRLPPESHDAAAAYRHPCHKG